MNIIKPLISLSLIILLVTTNAQVVVKDDVNCSDSIEVENNMHDIRLEQQEMNINIKNQLKYLEALMEFKIDTLQ
jgi:hypothetical protein